jgi:hypothetical protein
LFWGNCTHTPGALRRHVDNVVDQIVMGEIRHDCGAI